MQDKDRERRRHKKLEKRRKDRAGASRPAESGPVAAFDPARGRSWPTGECYVSLDWDEPGVSLVDLVFSRAREDGTSVVATFSLDRSGPGLVAARATGGVRQSQVAGESARLSEKSGRAMVACAPSLVAALVEEAQQKGSAPEPAGAARAVALLEGVPRAEIAVPFGPVVEEPAPPPKPGLLAGLRRRLFGG
jgi:hypothetical protein